MKSAEKSLIGIVLRYQFEYAEEVDYIHQLDGCRRAAERAVCSIYRHQSRKYFNYSVGSLDQLRRQKVSETFGLMIKPFGSEKHIDWLIHSVVKAHEESPSISMVPVVGSYAGS